MPPKPAGKGKPPKSPKLSKAEKEKLKKEEAEQKAKEEEEARLQEEQEKREREEKEQLEQEEKQRLWEEEKARHQAELDEVQEILDLNEQQLINLEGQQREKAKWDRYMLCDGSPDPLVECELNAFLHLWKEDSTPKPVKEALQDCEVTLKLISELDKHIDNAVKEELSEEEVLRHKESVVKLQELLVCILDRTTMQLLQTATDHLDPESQNLRYMSQSEHETLCVWGNTAKNPRLKCVTFDRQDFSVEIPKPLAVSNVAIRLLLTVYDHLSPLAKSFLPRMKKQNVPEVIVEAAPHDTEENPNQEEGEEGAKEEEGGDSTRDVATPKSASVAGRGSKAGRRKSARTGSSKSNRSRKASAKSARSHTSESESQKEGAKEGETEEGTGEEAKPEGEEAPEAADATLLVEDDDDDDDDDDVVDLRAFGVVGPIMYLELLELPPQPKHVKNWIIQQIVPPDLVHLPYQTQSETQTVSSGSIPSTPASTSAIQLPAPNPPLAVKFRLPSTVVYFEQPQIARWEPVKKQWRIDSISDSQYNEEGRTVSFKTNDFGPFATLQDVYLNMPFQSWELRPHEKNSCLFTLIAAIIELEIEIKDSLCCVSQPDDLPEIAHFRGKWMKPQQLIKTLQTAGINVFPAVDADKYVSINKKNEELETTIYKEMALVASAFGFNWSKWNADTGEDKIVLQAAEQLQDDMLLEEELSLYLITTRSSCKLKMKEEDSEFSENNAENTQLHSNLFHMIKDNASHNALQRIKETSFLFIDCVYQLLSATKVITYS